MRKTFENQRDKQKYNLARLTNFSSFSQFSTRRVTGPLFYSCALSNLGRVVRKPVNAYPALNVNRRIKFSCIKMFLTSYISCKLKLLKLKQYKQKTLKISYKTKIKVFANPGFAK